MYKVFFITRSIIFNSQAFSNQKIQNWQPKVYLPKILGYLMWNFVAHLMSRTIQSTITNIFMINH
jgi:hypothetical protein